MLSLHTIRLEYASPNSLLKGTCMSSRKNAFFVSPQSPITSSKSTLSWATQSPDSRHLPENVISNLTVSQSPNFGVLNTQFTTPPATKLGRSATYLRNHWLDRVVEYVYSDWQPYDREDFELKTITLRFISLARTQTPNLDWACALAVGTAFSKWARYTQTRREYMADQLKPCIPDYDSTVSPKKSVASEPAVSKKEKIA